MDNWAIALFTNAGLSLSDHVKRGLNFGAIGSKRGDDRVCVLFGRRGDVENIPWLYGWTPGSRSFWQ
jgi:hypothetical protein